MKCKFMGSNGRCVILKRTKCDFCNFRKDVTDEENLNYVSCIQKTGSNLPPCYFKSKFGRFCTLLKNTECRDYFSCDFYKSKEDFFYEKQRAEQLYKKHMKEREENKNECFGQSEAEDA